MRKLEDWLVQIAQLVAFLTIVLYVVLIANANWPFIAQGSQLLMWLEGIKNYSTLVLLGLVALSASMKQSMGLRLVIWAGIAIVVIFQFFPETANYLIGVINEAGAGGAGAGA